MLVDDLMQLVFEFLVGRGGATELCWHILPDQDTQFVSPVIPACRFNLYMLANHVVAQILDLLDIELERVIGGSSIDAIGPEALIQRTNLESKLPIKNWA